LRILEVILWVLILCPIYTMVVYPLLMYVLSKVFPGRFVRGPVTPTVTQIIAAFNEEKSIASKLENSLTLDYPRDKLEILVVSDASTDRTDDIVRGFAERGVKLLRVEGNLGKSAVLNVAAERAGGDILAFSDATGHWNVKSIRKMAEHYADPRVGCVAGWVAYRYDQSLTAQGFSVYQRFVTSLRRAEASFGCGIVAPGSIHSIRKAVFRPLPTTTSGDMSDPFHTAQQGLRTTFEPEAVTWEESRTQVKDEWEARVRICMRALDFMVYALRRFPVLRSPLYCFQVMSHKFLRWLTGPLMIPILIINAILIPYHWVYAVLFCLQLAYYGLTLFGYVSSNLGIRVPSLAGLVFYNSVNLAYIVAMAKYLRGERVARWKPSR